MTGRIGWTAWAAGLGLAAAELLAAFGAAWLAWTAIFRGIGPGAAAGLCGLLLAALAAVAAAAFSRAVGRPGVSWWVFLLETAVSGFCMAAQTLIAMVILGLRWDGDRSEAWILLAGATGAALAMGGRYGLRIGEMRELMEAERC